MTLCIKILYIYHIYIIYIYIFNIIGKYFVNGVNIYNKNEFLNNIDKNVASFTIQNEITFENQDKITVNSSKFILIGNSNNATINFYNNKEVDILFSEKCETIEIKNIYINGNLKFYKNKEIIFDNVHYNGFFISSNPNSINNKYSINITNSNFNLSNQWNNGFEITGYDLDINYSNFYGNNFNNMYFMKFDGDTSNALTINNSLFSGNYHNSGIEAYYGKITCINSTFENFYNGKELNGYINYIVEKIIKYYLFKY